MTDIRAYYFSSFERDLDAAIGTQLPRCFGGTWRTQGCPELVQVVRENRAAFIACLYYSVLLDQGLCHHAHSQYKRTDLFAPYPKFRVPGKGHMKPREILRHPIHWGVVSAEELTELAAPAADLFVSECIDTITKFFPKTSPSDFFYLLTNYPAANYWSPRVVRRYPAEAKVEQAFLDEMLRVIDGVPALH